MPAWNCLLSRKTSGRFELAVFAVCLIVRFFPLFEGSAQTSPEGEFIAILNEERVTLGKNPITINSCLVTAAYLHSHDMAEQGYFSHTSLDGRTFDQRIIAAGYTSYISLAENIAYSSGEPNAAQVYDMWKNSAGHYANMMGDYNEAGLGVYSKNGFTYYTLDLGRSRNVSPAPTSSPTPTPTPCPTATIMPTSIPTFTSSPTPTEILEPSQQSTNTNGTMPLEVFYMTVILGVAVLAPLTVLTMKKSRSKEEIE